MRFLSSKKSNRTSRTYTQRVRAERALETRRRILAVAREDLPTADALRVDEIARRAGVSVQTVYSHFQSKGGLLVALVDKIEKEAGLYQGFEAIWRSTDGEAALRAALEAALDLWEDAWDFIAFTLRVRRTDAELGLRIEGLDKSRLGHLRVICRRLQEESRLASGLSAGAAARLAFALTTPYVYEALVVKAGMPARVARRHVVEAVARVVLRPGSTPVHADRIDWRRIGLRAPTLG
jgi:AcrR family transcriptional regulator